MLSEAIKSREASRLRKSQTPKGLEYAVQLAITPQTSLICEIEEKASLKRTWIPQRTQADIPRDTS
jgi:hypothetical protein